MKIPAYSLVVVMGLTSAAQPALAQAAAPDRAAAKASIQEALARGDTQRAYETYDGFVAASRRPDAELLSPLAADELRAIASHAVDDPRLQVEAWNGSRATATRRRPSSCSASPSTARVHRQRPWPTERSHGLATPRPPRASPAWHHRARCGTRETSWRGSAVPG